MTIGNKLKSRKFWMALLGAIMPIAAQAMTESIPMAEALQLSAAILMSYILGQGYVDGQGAKASLPAPAPAKDGGE
jgi:hypothetical protein